MKGEWEDESESESQSCPTLQPQGLCSPWNSPGQNTGVGSLSLLQGIFPTQRSNPGLPHCRRILYQLSHKGSPRILEWVAYPFSSRSSQPSNRARVSRIACGFFTDWAMREAPNGTMGVSKNQETGYAFQMLKSNEILHLTTWWNYQAVRRIQESRRSHLSPSPYPSLSHSPRAYTVAGWIFPVHWQADPLPLAPPGKPDCLTIILSH